MDMLFNFLYEYGLFLAKVLTLLVAAVVFVVVVIVARVRDADRADGQLETTDLNERYRELGAALRDVSLSAKELKAIAKAEKKACKVREAERGTHPRLFVISFKGDIRASEVAALRELVTAILLEARPKDEVLVRLDNPGGLVSDHGLAASQLVRLREQGVPLTVAIDKVAASGGYLMACVANRIIAAPFAVVGSIGVLAEIPNFNRLLERNGIDFELHSAGKYKRTVTLFGKNTDEDRKKLRDQLEETHVLFKNFVAEYRPGLDLEKVATGEYWHGQTAIDLGLVDTIQTSDDYLLTASKAEKDLLELDYRRPKTGLERLFGSLKSTFGSSLEGLLAMRRGY